MFESLNNSTYIDPSSLRTIKALIMWEGSLSQSAPVSSVVPTENSEASTLNVADSQRDHPWILFVWYRRWAVLPLYKECYGLNKSI